MYASKAARKAYGKQYYRKNKLRLKAAWQAYRKEYYKKNKIRLLKQRHEYSLAHKKEQAARVHAWYMKHKKESRARQRKWVANNREHVRQEARRRHLKRTYHILPGDYNALLHKQNGGCAICKEVKNTSLTVDHDHQTGKIRGLLCQRCNRGLGQFGDNTKLLISASNYLKKGTPS